MLKRQAHTPSVSADSLNGFDIQRNALVAGPDAISRGYALVTIKGIPSSRSCCAIGPLSPSEILKSSTAASGRSHSRKRRHSRLDLKGPATFNPLSIRISAMRADTIISSSTTRMLAISSCFVMDREPFSPDAVGADLQFMITALFAAGLPKTIMVCFDSSKLKVTSASWDASSSSPSRLQSYHHQS